MGGGFYLYPFLSNSPTGQTAHHIFTINGSTDADSCKGVPFMAFIDTAAHLGDQTAQKKHNFRDVNRHFPAKRVKY